MGGKDGGGGGDPQGQLRAGGYVQDPKTGTWYNGEQWRAEHPEPAAAPAPVQETASVMDPGGSMVIDPVPTTPEPETPATPDPLGPATDAGTPISQPLKANNPMGAGSITNSGDLLGGAVVKPPTYWVGGINRPTSPVNRMKVTQQV
jgi:hypothetical protein